MSDIVLATDGSSHSLDAARFIVQEGLLPADGKVHVLHVSTALPSRVTRFVDKESVDSWYAEEAAKVLDPTIEVLEAAGVPFEPWALVGFAPKEIVEHAKKIGARMIVMGAHGRGVLLDAVIGSVAGRVLSLAECPVLLVKSPPKTA
ncbi:universal stress protein [Castellaniella sp. GW247-6E4]|uniref:universal stress protein n=1 Tax=Castellaniella sp. GW247-6E4 TaxID=3140380 RepID=UPI0033158314